MYSLVAKEAQINNLTDFLFVEKKHLKIDSN